MSKILVATRLEAQTFRALQDLAQLQERKVAYLVRKAVEQFIQTADLPRNRAKTAVHS